jgi:trigger factor
MLVTKENTGELNAVLKVKVEKNDYEGKVENTLKEYRRKANIKGFRPGMVPMGLVRKMYGKAVQLEEINKLVSESIQKYLTDEKIEILGDPLPKTDEQERINFDTQEEFTFSFELGLAPAVDLQISKKNKVTGYEITIDEKMKNDHVSNYTRRYGEFRVADEVTDKDILKGRIEALGENGEPAENSKTNEHSTLAVDIIKDEEIKNLFIGKKAGESIDFNVRKAFPNDNEIAGLLGISKDEVGALPENFRYTISEVSRFTPAEQGIELYNKIYGEGLVTNNEEFMQKITDEISASLKRETDYKLLQDIKKMVVDVTELSLPEDFLKRWLLKVNENINEEQIEKEFDSFRSDLKWQLIMKKLAKDNEIKISEEELVEEAKKITRFQFQQYGLFYATDEQITNYAMETLKREEDARRIADKILEEKVLNILKDQVKIEEKTVTAEEFNKLFE